MKAMLTDTGNETEQKKEREDTKPLPFILGKSRLGGCRLPQNPHKKPT
ncbi:hypothetical protein [Vibrio parahaemolyticus]|nr:hypothetical protein [Vibrio parahaemolyticus]UJW92777.1 hypothetical protein JHS83_25095 [Vibrio parahaemolyticus]UJX06942.1 hypothetical protein JHS88_24745 [Vibrio parahaemolyticus]UJX06995.1 hypothetical protein JHS88_25465 [Vibrio parahaemolyticus]WCZ09797.1 hypothetical protein GSR97_26425 [Vibrio parahaemolyticus]WCZ14738.1 hypothetical protein GSS20_25830 [Vibrio parahaemolyticus]